MEQVAILWRRLDTPGHETARLFYAQGTWRLHGTAVFLHAGEPCRLKYLVVCDDGWQTLRGRVAGRVGGQAVEIEIQADAQQRWWLNGAETTGAAGCYDLDLNFSPSTNLLPIRRLGLAVGQAAEVQAAWLRFPSFRLEPLNQVYRRTGANTYRYESAGGAFVRDLEVDGNGFVRHYPGFWVAENLEGIGE